MLDLKVDCDRPVKYKYEKSFHVLRMRLSCSSENNNQIPTHIAIAVDTSSTMEGERLGHAVSTCEAIIAQLRPVDSLSLAGFSTSVRPILTKIGPEEVAIATQKLKKNLTPYGCTRTDLALDWLHKTFSQDTTSSVRIAILLTDGYATDELGNVVKNCSVLLEKAEKLAQAGVILYCFGIGTLFHGDHYLTQLSERAMGKSFYLDSPEDLDTQLPELITQVQAIAFSDAKIHLKTQNNLTFKRFCRIKPYYQPLFSVDKDNQKESLLLLGLIGLDTPNDFLIELEIPELDFGEVNHGSQKILELTLTASGLNQPVTGSASVIYSSLSLESQKLNREIDNLRRRWDLICYSECDRPKAYS